MEEMNIVIPEFQNEAELEEWVMSQMVPETEGDELSEEALEMVAGGMSYTQAWKIVTTAYWELNVQKKKKSSYSSKQIMEALKKCDKQVGFVGKASKDILRWAWDKFMG